MEKYRQNLPVHHYFCLSITVPDITTSENRQNSSLSFGNVPNIFTCPPLFLPVLDMQTVSSFHPCPIIHVTIFPLKVGLFTRIFYKNSLKRLCIQSIVMITDPPKNWSYLCIVQVNCIHKLLGGIYRTGLTWKDQNLGRKVEFKYEIHGRVLQ